MKKLFLLIVISITISGTYTGLLANVKLPQLLSDNMMFQRDMEIKIWGWADKNENITVKFNDAVKKTKTGKDGKWKVIFPAMKAGGPYEMTVSGKNEIRIKNILVGDVWICSGQSNMEWTVANSNNAEKEISGADYPLIRLLEIGHNLQYSPVDDVPETGWKVCSPKSIPSFSAVGYFFGRKIHQETGVPVGLISTNWGGTLVEAWIGREYLTGLDNFDNKMEKLDHYDRTTEARNEKEQLTRFRAVFNLGKIGDEAEKEDWSGADIDYTYWKEARLPGLWEASGLPGIDGVVWYRKEFDIPREIAEQGITVELGKIDDSDITWINGRKIGETINKYDAERIYTAGPEILKPGRNVIAIRVEDTGGGGGIYRGDHKMQIISGDYRQNLEGDWKYKLTGENLRYNPSTSSPNEVPTSLYNGMIHPLLNLAVKGSIWYQGESNADRAYQYRYLFPLMIQCWREKWQRPDMPFFFVQLANWRAAKEQPVESDWAELREAQLLTMLNDENTGMAVTIDIGNPRDIHPRNKQDVGYRLALNALKKVYGQEIVYQGPVYASVAFSDGMATIDFSSKGGGLVAKDKYGYLKGFAIAGEDRIFHWAKALVKDNQVMVWSEMVSKPVEVRYAWADNPEDANLYNREGLPASPFRTDDWEGITYGKK